MLEHLHRFDRLSNTSRPPSSHLSNINRLRSCRVASCLTAYHKRRRLSIRCRLRGVWTRTRGASLLLDSPASFTQTSELFCANYVHKSETIEKDLGFGRAEGGLSRYSHWRSYLSRPSKLHLCVIPTAQKCWICGGICHFILKD